MPMRDNKRIPLIDARAWDLAIHNTSGSSDWTHYHAMRLTQLPHLLCDHARCICLLDPPPRIVSVPDTIPAE